MRLILAAMLVAAVTSHCAEAAPTYPWCTTGASQEFGARNCGFVSFEQCLDSARGNGQFCEQNPAYQPPVSASPKRARKARKNPSR